MKSYRTVRKIVEEEYDGDEIPKYEIGQWVEIYSGSFEGHNFKIEDVRFDNDNYIFEYLYKWPLYDIWIRENNLT